MVLVKIKMQELTAVSAFGLNQDVENTSQTARSEEISDIMCFVCAKTYYSNKLIRIFSNDGEKDQLCNKICNYTPFKVTQLEHPDAVICEICRTNINNWDIYLQSCIETKQILCQELRKYNEQPSETAVQSMLLSKTKSNVSLSTSRQNSNTGNNVNASESKNTQKLRTTYCIARWCSNNTGNPHHVSFFRIPKDKKRADQWLYNASRTDLLNHDLKILHTKYICEKHFTDNMFMNKTHKRLIWNAVPNIFPKPKPFSSLQTEVKDPPENSLSANLILSEDFPELKNCETNFLSLKESLDENFKEIANYISAAEASYKSKSIECIRPPLDCLAPSHALQHDEFSGDISQSHLSKTFPSESDSLMSEANESFIKSEVDGECLQSSEIMYPCIYCGEVFLVESNLIVHQTTYHPGYSVGCGLCGQVEYHSKGEFLEHACTAH